MVFTSDLFQESGLSEGVTDVPIFMASVQDMHAMAEVSLLYD
jgi:hypothetical protein